MTTEAKLPHSSQMEKVTNRDRRRAVIGAAVGNGIEFYDFAVYGAVAAYVGANFFPSDDKVAELLSSFAVFGLSFLIRPIGGLIFGPLADRLGRRKVMILVLTLMSVSTACIGLLPTHASIGALAPALLVVLRCIQGLSAGGEFGTVATFLSEYARPGRRGAAVSWNMASTIAGFMLGITVSALLLFAIGSDAMSSWGWRVPFLLAAPIGAISFWIRIKLEDSPVFIAMAEQGNTSPAPLREAFATPRPLIVTACLAAVHATTFYVVFTFMVGFISTELALGSNVALVSTLIAGVLAMTVLPFLGKLSDRVGRRPMLLAGAIGVAALSYPMFSLASSGGTAGAVVAQCVLALLLAVVLSSSQVAMTEVFPPRVRSAGISVAYNLPAALLGGMAPYVSTWLVARTGDTRAPAFYLIACALIGLAGICFGLRKSLAAASQVTE